MKCKLCTKQRVCKELCQAHYMSGYYKKHPEKRIATYVYTRTQKIDKQTADMKYRILRRLSLEERCKFLLKVKELMEHGKNQNLG